MDQLKTLVAHVGNLLGSEITLAKGKQESIDKLKSVLPEFPDSLLEYLKVFDGDNRILHPYWLLGAERILIAYRKLINQNQMIGEYPSFVFSEPYPFQFDKFWRTNWIPIAELNNEDYFFIDLDPGPGGKTGQIGFMESLELNLIAGSLGEWFEAAIEKITPPSEGENEWDDQIWYSI